MLIHGLRATSVCEHLDGGAFPRWPPPGIQPQWSGQDLIAAPRSAAAVAFLTSMQATTNLAGREEGLAAGVPRQHRVSDCDLQDPSDQDPCHSSSHRLLASASLTRLYLISSGPLCCVDSDIGPATTTSRLHGYSHLGQSRHPGCWPPRHGSRSSLNSTYHYCSGCVRPLQTRCIMCPAAAALIGCSLLFL